MAVLGLLGAALYQEMRKPQKDREWHGHVVGVPYDFRPPTSDRFRAAWWNDRAGLLTPAPWGIGWTVNVYRLRAMLTAARTDATAAK
ncbi:MAG: hypothetical protein JO247_01200 [Chloroflexi bacterium]|nr:hypothetical protein [Chloroflexota bacterium]